MKKIAMLIIAMAMTFTAQAQYTYQYKQTPFHADKYYIGASLSGLDLNYSGSEDLKLGAQCEAGYFVFDNFALLGMAGYNSNGKAPDSLNLGAGARYYIEQNGLFLGARVNYVHANKSFNDVQPGVELGYAFFLSRTVTLEPALYYNQSFKSHSDYSNLGIKLGLSIYLND